MDNSLAATHVGAGGELDGSQPSQADLLAFQANLWELLDHRVALYTSGESSSVPQSTAHRLLASVLYVLGIDADDMDPEELHRLAHADLKEEFERGLGVIRKKTEACAELWKQVCLTTPLLESTALKDTLTSIDTFIKSYDCRFFAHEIGADIDYPLCHPVPESFQGIDYIHEYLSRLQIENTFMNCFDLAQEKALLRRLHSEYRALIINLFEPIATNALGQALIGADLRQLNITEDARSRIAETFDGLSPAQSKQRLALASEHVCRSRRITARDAQGYLKKLSQDIYPRIRAFAGGEGLAGVFLSF